MLLKSENNQNFLVMDTILHGCDNLLGVSVFISTIIHLFYTYFLGPKLPLKFIYRIKSGCWFWKFKRYCVFLVWRAHKLLFFINNINSQFLVNLLKKIKYLSQTPLQNVLIINVLNKWENCTQTSQHEQNCNNCFES